MINLLLAGLSTIIIYEFLRFLKFIFIVKSNLKIYKKIIKLLKSKKVSDFRKEKLILNYSKSLFIISFKIFFIIILIFFFILLIDQLSNSFLNFIVSTLGIIEIILISTIYSKLRMRFNAKL